MRCHRFCCLFGNYNLAISCCLPQPPSDLFMQQSPSQLRIFEVAVEQLANIDTDPFKQKNIPIARI